MHCDLNSFFASVELLSFPELRDKPVAVCGDPQKRHGIILAKNDNAKKHGIVTAETVWKAKSKCPDLVLLPPNYDKYVKYSAMVNEIYEGYTDLVEPFGIDESWLDITASMHLFANDGKAIADAIREKVKTELGLTLSVGVSFNKMFAKLGSDYKKPDATTVLSRDNYKEIIYPLPVSNMLYVGKAATEKLYKYGIKTIGQLAVIDIKTAYTLLGKMGEIIHGYANGLDDSPVIPESDKDGVKSVGNGMTFSRNLVGLSDIKAGVIAISDMVATRLRSQNLKCRTVQVLIRDQNFKSISRQRILPVATNLANEISRMSIEIICASWKMQKPIRMITITGTNLVPENIAEQVSLFIEEDGCQRQKLQNLERTMDNIRTRFGRSSILYGSTVNNDIGIDNEKDK